MKAALSWSTSAPRENELRGFCHPEIGSTYRAEKYNAALKRLHRGVATSRAAARRFHPCRTLAAMSIRSWLEKRRQRAEADAIKRAEEDWVESPEERGRGDFMDQGADNRSARRMGETPDEVNRLGDFNP